MKIHQGNIELFNRNLRYEEPREIVRFVLGLGADPVLSTSFGPFSAALIHLVTRDLPDIPVLWCDTGYNTSGTYTHMERLTETFDLDLRIITPKYTTAYLEHRYGPPVPGEELPPDFSKLVKIDPLKEAIHTLEPDLWFSNIRKGQTQYRDGQDILSFTESGILKVSPFYHFDNRQLYAYMQQHELPAEFDYHDPVKVRQDRECGIHLSI